MKVLLTHPGTQHAPKLAWILEKNGLLYRFATGIAFPDTPNAWWWRMAAKAGQEKLLLKRVIPGLPKGKLHLQPLKEVLALYRHQKLRQANDAVFYPRNKAFQEQLPQRLIDAADVVIGFDTSSWVLAGRCRKAGKPFILDASIAHPLAKEKVYDELRRQYPGWAKELAPKQPHLIEAELSEIENATHIVVASAFTKKTYTDYGVAPEKITINPYGTDLKGQIPKEQIPNSKGDDASILEFGISNFGISTSTIEKKVVTPVGRIGGEVTSPPAGGPGGATFLFFGSLSARKGFPLLCKVWQTFHERYPHCRLIAAGYDNRPTGFRVPDGVEVLGAVHPANRAALFASADVFVFPSFFEGFAQVILEAMVCGLPVITTTATAGPDLFGTADCGRIIEPGNEVQLLHALEYFAQNPHAIPAMRQAALSASASFTWHAYGERWVRVLNGV